MLVLKIEFWPLGQEKKASEIGRMLIINDGTGDESVGNYDVRWGNASKPSEMKSARVLGFERRKKFWQLVFLAMRAAVGFRVSGE